MITYNLVAGIAGAAEVAGGSPILDDLGDPVLDDGGNLIHDGVPVSAQITTARRRTIASITRKYSVSTQTPRRTIHST